MAQYHLSATMVSRKKGQSAVGSAAYRAGERIKDEHRGKWYDYRTHPGILHKEILAPDDTPDWMLDRAQLWNAVEKIEKRKDSQVARSIDVSLMSELSLDQNVELIRGFIREQFVKQGMIADLAIHAPGPDSDDRNIHAHILLTTRVVTGSGFGKKNRDWDDREELREWREAWADHANRALEREGFDARIDHRTLEDQGIDREPTTHVGPSGKAMEKSGRTSDRAKKNRDIKATNDQLDLIKEELAQSEERLADLRRRLDAERMEQIQDTARPADAAWEKAQPGQGPAQPLQPQGPRPYPENSRQQGSARDRADNMPDDASKQKDLADQQEADRVKKAIDDELARQEQARRDQDQIQNELIAADKRFKELGQLWRQAQDFREKLIQQARELEEANVRYQQQQAQRQQDSQRQQNPVEDYTREHKDGVEQRRQERQDEQDRRYLEGNIRNPYSRYAQALHENYQQSGDLYQGLAKSAIAEHAAFQREQDTLRGEIAKTTDPKHREALEIRAKIECYEYLMITGERIAVQSEIITGRIKGQEAEKMRGLVRGETLKDENDKPIGFIPGYTQEVENLRVRYRDLQAERAAQPKEQAPSAEQKQDRPYRPRGRRSTRELDELIKRQNKIQEAKDREDEKKKGKNQDREKPLQPDPERPKPDRDR
jgi:hypothetical protein